MESHKDVGKGSKVYSGEWEDFSATAIYAWLAKVE
jgi:hypothetical protein